MYVCIYLCMCVCVRGGGGWIRRRMQAVGDVERFHGVWGSKWINGKEGGDC